MFIDAAAPPMLASNIGPAKTGPNQTACADPDFGSNFPVFNWELACEILVTHVLR